uniref:endo-1,4-beta-xylanase n=1 Tax=uncultured symbiotic protist of Reticulitermes speratus TaxID=403658 RepID=A4UWQ7_9EUKA|nr:putative glycosyl hydrolase family11 [uncultured symbiotic protist of Reticulitermes speratus]
MKFVFALFALAFAGSFEPLNTTASNAACTVTSNQQGNCGGVAYELWMSGGGGGCSCTIKGDGTAAFSAQWNNCGDYLCRAGRGSGSTSGITANYAYTKSGSGGGYSFIGIYGWTTSPLVEYYIVDDWFSGGGNSGGSQKGSFTQDGATYNIWQHTQNNQPSIQGTATFEQFFSIRSSQRTSGSINVSAHFDKWNSLGMRMGSLYEAKLLIEAGGGSGSIDYSTGTI